MFGDCSGGKFEGRLVSIGVWFGFELVGSRVGRFVGNLVRCGGIGGEDGTTVSIVVDSDPPYFFPSLIFFPDKKSL